MKNQYRVTKAMESVLLEGTKKLQMVRGASVVLDFDEKSKKESESICHRRGKWTKESDVGVGSENQGHRLVDQRQAT